MGERDERVDGASELEASLEVGRRVASAAVAAEVRGLGGELWSSALASVSEETSSEAVLRSLLDKIELERVSAVDAALEKLGTSDAVAWRPSESPKQDILAHSDQVEEEYLRDLHQKNRALVEDAKLLTLTVEKSLQELRRA